MHKLVVALAFAFYSVAQLLGQPATSTPGRDWFVRAGEVGGDGTVARPFADPWEALEVCEAGDRVHVAAGEYTGRFGAGTWVIPFDRVALYGGYDARFETRDPWANPAHLSWDPASKNWPRQARLTSQAHDVVVDGFVLDMQGQVQYADEARTGRTGKPSESAMEFSQPATIENCVVVNPGFHGIDVVPGSRVRNNLVLNALDWGVTVTTSVGPFARQAAEIERNTILFSWDLQKPGGGGYGGAAIALRGSARITRNILAYCDNSAIYSVHDVARHSITGNVFSRNRFANVTAQMGADRAVANDADMELLEEFGLAAYDGNVVADPGLPVDPDWAAKAAIRDIDLASKPEVDPEPLGWGETRQLEITKGIAPAYSLAAALRLLEPTSAGPAGARRAPVSVAYQPEALSASSAKSYATRPLLDWHQRPSDVEGQRLELVVAIGGVANVSAMPPVYDPSKIAGVFLYDPLGSGSRITGFYSKGTNVQRVCDDATGHYQGQGKPERLFVARGVAHAVATVPKAALFVESITPYEATSEAEAPRPLGRDWFVRQGATGGDGSRERPFRDPFQALERCERGDTIHVTEGEYVGRLKAGRWRIDMPYVALLGGYDAQFTSRDPWAHPTRLLCPVDFQGRRGGYTLEGSDDHTGAVVDGFVFDKALNNAYDASGALHLLNSDKSEHLWLYSPGCTIRNCVFVNGAEGALRVANGQRIENNVFVNHFTRSVAVESGHTIDPIVIRGNTFAFAWSNRPGQGLGASGYHLLLGSRVRATVEQNVFGWADNDGIRLDGDTRDVTLRDNVFAFNLWSNLQRSRDNVSFDDNELAQAAELGFRAFEGNRVVHPQLEVEVTWLAQHQATRGGAGRQAGGGAATPTAPAPARNPFDDPDPAGAAPPAADPAAAPRANPFDDAPSAAAAKPGEPPIAALYPWQAALSLFRASSQVGLGAGARRSALTVEFSGVSREEAQHEYKVVSWADAADAARWEGLEGQRVQLEVAIARVDNQYTLPGITAADHLAVMVGGPRGTDSGGLPMRCYVPLGTRTWRAVVQAKGYGPGAPEEVHVISGIARTRRQLVVERVERRP